MPHQQVELHTPNSEASQDTDIEDAFDLGKGLSERKLRLGFD